MYGHLSHFQIIKIRILEQQYRQKYLQHVKSLSQCPQPKPKVLDLTVGLEKT